MLEKDGPTIARISVFEVCCYMDCQENCFYISSHYLRSVGSMF